MVTSLHRGEAPGPDRQGPFSPESERFLTRRGRILELAGPTAAVAAAVAVLDQVMKAAIGGYLLNQEGTEVWLIEPVLSLRLVHNTGLVFGMFSGAAMPWAFTALVVTAVVALVWVYSRQLQRPTLATRLVFGMTFGGALGNLIDRFRFGYVVDYVSVGPWPVFNVADAAIDISIVLFVILLLAGRVERRPNLPAPFTR